MNCPICKNELEIKQKKVGENAAGETIYNEFAICHNCKKQWNLDKQRAKKQMAAKEESADQKEQQTAAKEKPADRKEQPAEKKVVRKKTVQHTGDGTEQPVRKRKKRPVSDAAISEAAVSTEQTSDAPRPKKKRPVNPDGTPVRRKPASEHRENARPTRPDGSEERPRRPKKHPKPAVSDDFIDFDRDDELEEIVVPQRVEKQTYSNIPPKHVREAREKEMKENYQNMLDEDDEEEGGAPIILILIIIILLLAIAAFCGYWFILR